MGLLSFLRSLAQTNPGPVLSDRYLRSWDFQKRLIRAREGNLQILEYIDAGKSSAKIRNTETGHEYTTTISSCECDDFQKNRKPCKHMLFLMLKTDRYRSLEKQVTKNLKNAEDPEEFVPIYWEYYDGPPTGIGYVNYYPYEVIGRAYGVSEKTGKPTNKKSRIVVMANSEDEAKEQAQKKGTMPPYSGIECLDFSPSFEQIKYLDGVGIPHPNLLCGEDVRALLTRYQESDDSRPTKGIIRIANERRVQISMFSSQKQVAAYVWGSMGEAEKARYYCYAAYCQENNLTVGETDLKYTDKEFGGFQLTKKQIRYIEYTEPGYARLDGRAGAYKAAKEYLTDAKLIPKK